MATRIETYGGAAKAPRTAWMLLFAIVVVAAVVAILTLARPEATTQPAPSDRGARTAVEPASHVPGLVKAGLQPRPFSPIPIDDGAETIPSGFVRLPGGELRPVAGS